MRQLHRPAIIVHRSQCVAACAEGHDFRAPGHQLCKMVPIQLAAFRIHLRDIEPHPALNLKRLPRRNIRVMLELSNDDLVARPQRASERSRQVIDR